MKKQLITGMVLLVCVIACTWAVFSAPKGDDQGQIKALEDRFLAAFKAKDLAAIMSCYVSGEGLFVFDVIPPRQYVGFEAYKKDWQDFLALFDGPVNVEISDLSITGDDRIAFGHSIQHVSGKLKEGKTFDLTVRVTDGYRKVNGQWLVAHEHVSVPVDIFTGKPDLTSKP